MSANIRESLPAVPGGVRADGSAPGQHFCWDLVLIHVITCLSFAEWFVVLPTIHPRPEVFRWPAALTYSVNAPIVIHYSQVHANQGTNSRSRVDAHRAAT